MSVPILLLLASVALGVFAHDSDASGPGDLLLLGLITGVAALVLVLRDVFAPGKARPRTLGRRKPYIVLDGSNVMHWDGKAPSLDPVRSVVERVRAEGLEPVIWFDANVGYKIGDGYLGPAALARRLGCARARVHVAPKGTPADPLLLQHAVSLDARVVSNDRFRDWQEAFPALERADFLVRMRARDQSGTLEL
ncbi:MAG: hypothetical protein EP318_16995 [Rhodobacteraceae bacterium]|nr:MAG: hypothetical protein EP318_16995 [Paracoccaceae bacterium]